MPVTLNVTFSGGPTLGSQPDGRSGILPVPVPANVDDVIEFNTAAFFACTVEEPDLAP
jgi:hypothetical protein